MVSPLMCLKLKVLSVRGISDQIKALIMLQPGSMNIFRFSVNSDLSQTKHTVKSKDSKKEVQALNVREAALSTCHEALFDSKKQKQESHRKRRESFNCK